MVSPVAIRARNSHGASGATASHSKPHIQNGTTGCSNTVGLKTTPSIMTSACQAEAKPSLGYPAVMHRVYNSDCTASSLMEQSRIPNALIQRTTGMLLQAESSAFTEAQVKRAEAAALLERRMAAMQAVMASRRNPPAQAVEPSCSWPWG